MLEYLIWVATVINIPAILLYIHKPQKIKWLITSQHLLVQQTTSFCRSLVLLSNQSKSALHLYASNTEKHTATTERLWMSFCCADSILNLSQKSPYCQEMRTLIRTWTLNLQKIGQNHGLVFSESWVPPSVSLWDFFYIKELGFCSNI